jgi:hypothetical protein
MYCHRRNRIVVCVIAFLLLATSPLLSQFNATLFVQPFPSPYPGDWQSNPSIAYITVNNNTGLPLQVRVDLRISRQSDGSSILSGTSNTLVIPPSPPLIILNNTQFINLSNVRYDGSLKTKVAMSGRLPEGEYVASIDIRDVSGLVLQRNVTSQPFTIVYPPAPMLIYPVDGDSIIQPYPVLQWAPASAPNNYVVHYALKIVEVLTSQVPAQALASNAMPQLQDLNVMTTNLVYPVSALPLRAGTTYAWWVQALDQNNYPATTNNGHSQIFTFTYKGNVPPPPPPEPPRPLAECMQLTPVLPGDGSALKSLSLPKFSLNIRPAINRAGVRSGLLRVWEMGRKGEPGSSVMAKTPVLITTFDTTSARFMLTMRDSATSLLEVSPDTTRRDSVFAAIQKKWYMWQLSLNYDPKAIRADGAICQADSVISGAYTFQCDTTVEEPDSGACKDICSIPKPSDEDAFAGQLAAGDTIQAGRFMMITTEVRGTGYALSGKGTIAVPLLHTKLAVEFSGIKVNKEKQLIDGEITGSQAENSPLTKDEANAPGSTLNLKPDQIDAVQTIASNVNRCVKGLTGQETMTLPLGLDNEIGGERYVIGIIGVTFKPTAAYLNAAMSYPLPDLGPGFGIGLGAREICFSPGGFGGNGLVTLYLASDIGYGGDDSWRFAFLSPKKEEPGCSVTFDCHGFKKLVVSAEVKFPRTWLRPFPKDDGTSRVTASFQTTVGRGGNFIASAGMDRCEIAGAPGFVLEVKELAFDKSSDENPKDIEFPQGYKGAKDESWTGFFIKRASISLPPQLRTFDSTQPPQISVNNLIISKTGLTGDFRAENVFMYPKGNFGEWGGSLDTLGIDIINSSLERGWLTGKIKMPISETPLRYTATLSRPPSGDTSRGITYAFVLQPDSTISADLWKAKISLSPTSSITIGNDNPQRKFVAAAVLNGSVTIAGDIGGIPHVNFPGIAFQDLRLQSTKPYFSKGIWSFASPEKGLAGFPVSISNIDVASTQRDGKDLTGLKFTVSVNLSPGTNAISGGTALTLWGMLDPGGRSGQKFSFYGIELDSVGVNADLGPVKVQGELTFYREDPVFGSGFRGAVNADILKRIAVTSTLQFGQVSGFRYFYVDAKGMFNPGIAFGTTGVGFYGVGGGFWWNMRREDQAQPTVPASSGLAGSEPGATASGFRFVPSEGNFGFKAMVVLGTHPSPVAFNADVILEVELQRTSTGVSMGRITLQGNGYMMAEFADRQKAKVTCLADITYDFPTSTLHGVFNATINAPPVTGGGQMVMHIESNTWYMKIGEPSNRINLRLADWLQTDAYLMLGKNLPPPPPPPQRVLAILGAPSPNRDSRIAAGNGFAFGASMSFSTGRQYYFIFYGDVSAGGGFDIAMLKQTKCTGVNGWQAQGQLYAYVDASVGLHVNIGFYVYYPCGPWWCAKLCRWCRDGYVGYNGDFEVLGIHAAALLEAGGPNPLWVAGTVAGRYSILGGLVKGDCSFKFSKGTECRL